MSNTDNDNFDELFNDKPSGGGQSDPEAPEAEQPYGRAAEYGPRPDVCNLAAALHELEQCDDDIAFRSVAKRYCAWVVYDDSEVNDIVTLGHAMHKIAKVEFRKVLAKIQKETAKICEYESSDVAVRRLLEDVPDALAAIDNFAHIAWSLINAKFRDRKTDRRKICQWSGAAYYWTGTHWREFESGELDSKARLWLEKRPVVRRTNDGATLDPVLPDLQLIKQTTAAMMDRVRKPQDSLNTMPHPSGEVEHLGHHFLAVNNGILNMKTGELLESTPAFFNTNAVAASWLPDYADMTAEELQGAIDGTRFGALPVLLTPDVRGNLGYNRVADEADLGSLETGQHRTLPNWSSA